MQPFRLVNDAVAWGVDLYRIVACSCISSYISCLSGHARGGEGGEDKNIVAGFPDSVPIFMAIQN